MEPVNRQQPLNFKAISDSVAAEISKGKKVLSKGNRSLRLIVENKANRTDINVAIASKPNSISAFIKNRKWALLRVKVGENDQEVYVNINSLSKRLGIKKSEIRQASKGHTLENLVFGRMQEKLANLDMKGTSASSLIGTSKRSTGSIINRIKGALVDAWWQVTTGSWDLFRLRFMLKASDEELQKEGQLRAITAYRQAYKKVPAYRNHVRENAPKQEGKPQMPKRFKDIPQTGKKEYIQKAEHVDDLYLGGKLPKNGQLDSSTGTTGEPALWIRSAKELAVTQKLLSFAKKAKFGSEDVIMVNTFALGLWAAGVTLVGAGPKHGITANVGVVSDYAEKTVNIIKRLTEKNPNTPIALCGYPPNIRKIADAIHKDPILQSRNIKYHAIVGGEAMTEELRQDILDKGFESVFSSYGASDLDASIGIETETEVAIRKACMQNPALAEELYGGGPPPMIFHYDPLNYFIETNKDGELLFTCCRKERASPRIRYNLHDTGKVMMAKDMVSILKKYGVEISPRTNLPFLLIHGREGTVSYGGSKIHYEHLEQGIRALDLNSNINRDRFALFKPEEDELEFWIEASSDEAFEEMKANINQIQKDLINKIAESNTDFRKILEGKANPYPQIKLFKPKQSPMSIHAEANPHRKLQRVVVNSQELTEQLASHPNSFVESTGNYPS